LLLAQKPLAILWGMKQVAVILCLALAGGAVPAEEVYKVIQPDGTVEFTDSPPPGEAAEQVEIPPLNTAEPPASPTSSAPSSTDAASRSYSEFRITSPSDGESIRDNAGNVNIDLSLKPTLRSGDKIDVLLDGRSVGGGNKTAITLSEMNRGTHSVQALVKDSAGKVVARSNSVTFTLQRRSAILQPGPPRAVPFGGGRAN
jgi:hypothetical protein